MSLAADHFGQDDAGHQALGQFLLGLRARGRRDTRLLNAIERAPRPDFLPLEFVAFAYKDMSLPLECGQETGTPGDIVEIVHALDVERTHHVLEIGTGSGWQTALIAGMAGAVASIERWETLAEAADDRLQALGFANVVVAHGDGSGGMPAAGPFDRIVFNAMIDEVSPLILAQLREDGFMLAPMLHDGHCHLMRIAKAGDEDVSVEPLFAVERAPLMSGLSENL